MHARNCKIKVPHDAVLRMPGAMEFILLDEDLVPLDGVWAFPSDTW